MSIEGELPHAEDPEYPPVVPLLFGSKCFFQRRAPV